MCDDIFDDSNECDIKLAQNEWDRLNDDILKDGHREGYSEAYDSSLQKGFDCGYDKMFGPTEVISFFAGITDVLKFHCNSKNDDITLNQLKDIQLNINRIMNLMKEQLMNISESHSPTQFTPEIVDLFNQLKHDYVTICDKLSLLSLKEQIIECHLKNGT